MTPPNRIILAAAALCLGASTLAPLLPLQVAGAAESSPSLANPSFERDDDGDRQPDRWTHRTSGSNNARWSTTRDARSGEVADEVVIRRYRSGSASVVSDESEGLAVAAGGTYEVSAWYRTDAVARLFVRFRDADGSWWAGPVSDQIEMSADWRQLAMSVEAPADAVAMSVGVSAHSAGSLTVDDVAVVAAGDDTDSSTTTSTSTSTSTTSTSTTTTSTTTAPPPPDDSVLVRDDFDRADGLVTNEYAYWNPDVGDAVHDETWQTTSGSLFAEAGVGWSGVPDDATPDASSSTGTNSAVFRLLTHRSDLTNVDVAFRLRHEEFVSTDTTPAVAWDGVHVFLRYVDEENLYYASVARRDGAIVVKKKASGGSSNGGTYYTLATGSRPVTEGVWDAVEVSIFDQPDGSVAIEVHAGGRRLLSAVDVGTGGPPHRSGRTGIRGDNSQFSLDDFVVTGR